MLKTRVIPCLQLLNESLVKTVQFKNFSYIGDPINTARIFNELEVDELVLVDIRASKEKRQPNFPLLANLANECFMPLAYGGGIDSLETAKKIFASGFEKVILNTACFDKPQLVTEIANMYGSQAVVAAVDVKKNIWGKYEVYSLSGTSNKKTGPAEWVKTLEELGAGEILLTSIDREGTWKGFDTELIRKASEATTLPLIAQGGAANVGDIEKAVKEGRASAVALGSMVVFQGKNLGVLVNFPDAHELERVLE